MTMMVMVVVVGGETGEETNRQSAVGGNRVDQSKNASI